ncbi:MAG: hypothetical protein ACRDJ1_09850 [Actinomycetota bacterium]
MSLDEFLDQEYDLSIRSKPGDTSYYRETVLYRHLNDRGLPLWRELYQGDLRRVVDSVDAEGAAHETITWKNVIRRFGNDEDPLGPAEPLTWADGYEYQFCVETPQPEWSIEGWPNDLIGWGVHCLVIDAHYEYDFLRSTEHGAIGKLRRIGDVVAPPDDERPFPIHFGPFIEVPAFTKRNLRTRFTGLTRKNGEACGILAFDMDASPFHMFMQGNRVDLTPRFSGTLTVRLDDGALEHGQFVEWVMTEGKMISPVYEISRIEKSDYESGSIE